MDKVTVTFGLSPEDADLLRSSDVMMRVAELLLRKREFRPARIEWLEVDFLKLRLRAEYVPETVVCERVGPVTYSGTDVRVEGGFGAPPPFHRPWMHHNWPSIKSPWDMLQELRAGLRTAMSPGATCSDAQLLQRVRDVVDYGAAQMRRADAAEAKLRKVKEAAS